MATPILMPQIGQDIPKGKIIEWQVKEGDAVQRGDILVIVESEKATFEVEAYESGVVQQILFADGDEAAVLKPIAYLRQPEEEGDAHAERARLPQATPQIVFPSPPRPGRTFASPSVRRLAREHEIDLANIAGSGPGGRIIKRDILPVIAAKEQESTAPPVIVSPEVASVQMAEQVLPYSRMRRAIADRLTQSKQTIPHFYLFVEVDMTEALKWRAAYNERQNTRITVTDMIVKATADALVEFERMNAHADHEKLTLKSQVNVGVAVAVPDGLLVPVIPDANREDLPEISRICKQNADAARRGSLRGNAIGTFTITNLGMMNVHQLLPIINPPECGILGVASIEKRVVAIGNGIHIRDRTTLSLACDHRAVGGVYAAQFLNQIKQNLEAYTLV